jgi:hypothetical protein
MNILFSDDFASDFASLGNVASKESLDSGKAGNNQAFWGTSEGCVYGTKQ